MDHLNEGTTVVAQVMNEATVTLVKPPGDVNDMLIDPAVVCVRGVEEAPPPYMANALPTIATDANLTQQPGSLESAHSALNPLLIAESLTTIPDASADVYIKQEPDDDMLNPNEDSSEDDSDSEAEDSYDGQISYDRLRKELETIAKSSFTTEEAAQDVD